MRFAVLGSGSRGNATLIEGGDTRILVDCGFALRDLEARLDTLGLDGTAIAAVVVTHEHADHVTGVARFARRYGAEVWATPGTWRGAGSPEVPRLRLFSAHGHGFRIGGLKLAPIPVPHDAREPSQLVIEGDGGRLGVLTDTGTVTPRIRDALRECTALMLEANHDPAMLRQGPYPPSVQRRVGGAFGHLSNEQAAELLAAVYHSGLCRVLLSHLSARNNCPELAVERIERRAGPLNGRLQVAEQDRCSGWLDA